MNVKCTISDFLAAKLNKVGEVKLESVISHGDQVRITADNGAACVVNIDELVSAALKCKLDYDGR